MNNSLERFQNAAGLIGIAAVSVLAVFGFWDLVAYMLDAEGDQLMLLHILRGVSASLITATVIGWVILRHGRDHARTLREQSEQIARERDIVREIEQKELDAAPAGMVLVDEDMQVVRANKMARVIHGRELEGQSFFRAGCDRDAGCSGCPITDRIDGSPETSERPCVSPVTSEVFVPSVQPIALSDGRPGYLIVERVRTEQARLQAQLIHQEKMAAFGLLAAGIAHDLGNPINGIDMHLQLLEAEPGLPDEAHESVELVRHEVARMQRVLSELVEFARRRGEGDAGRDPVDGPLIIVRQVVEDALALMRHDPRMAEIELDTYFDPSAPPVQILEDHLMQVVLNILLNALDAMPDGGTLSVDVNAHGENVVLRMRDTGTGMSRDTLDRCFEPLFTTKPVGRGTGLGLSVCRDIISAASGRMDLHSSLGKGTTVIVYLPGAEQDAQPDDAGLEEATVDAPPALALSGDDGRERVGVDASGVIRIPEAA